MKELSVNQNNKSLLVNVLDLEDDFLHSEALLDPPKGFKKRATPALGPAAAPGERGSVGMQQTQYMGYRQNPLTDPFYLRMSKELQSSPEEENPPR